VAYVLVVDDEPSILAVMKRVLENGGLEVLEVADGKKCQAAVAARLPDAVVLDILMPEQDGLETLRALRGLHPELKILAISGGASGQQFDWLHFAKHLGANAVLEKPFSGEMLLKAVRALLPRGAQAGGAA
jgi:CheY-like chemotaxis protein